MPERTVICISVGTVDHHTENGIKTNVNLTVGGVTGEGKNEMVITEISPQAARLYARLLTQVADILDPPEKSDD